MNDTEKFFFENAGYSYNPKIESPFEGRTRCAAALAKAFNNASLDGYSWDWQPDDEYLISDIVGEDYHGWVCYLVRYGAKNDVLGALCGVDLGRDGHPTEAAYARVVEAELALEHITTRHIYS